MERALIGVSQEDVHSFRHLSAMSFNLSSFLEEPHIEEFHKLKTELLELGQHFKLSVNSSQSKGEIRKLVLAYLVDEEILPEESLEGTGVSDQGLELKQLEYQEKDKAMQLEDEGARNKGKGVSS